MNEKELIQKWKTKAQLGLSWGETQQLIKEAIKVGKESMKKEIEDLEDHSLELREQLERRD